MMYLILATHLWTFNVAADSPCAPRLDERLKRGALNVLGWTPAPAPGIAAELRRRVRARDDQFVIPREVVAAWSREFKLTPVELLTHFLPFVAETARAPSSEYMVGNVGLTEGGDVVVGNNLEFPPLPHVFSVHGETFLITLAYLRDLGPLSVIALSGGKACGHCRQFMFETVGARRLKIVVPGRRPVALVDYLPDAFDPGELGVAGLLLTPQHHAVRLNQDSTDPLVRRALAEARRAYAPYSRRPAGVALRTRDGRVFGGPYLENVNYNASMDPMAAAMVDLASHRVAYDQVTEAVLAELPSVDVDKDISFAETSRLILHARVPAARFHLHPLDRE
jgi:cytidine deaminase